MLSSLEIMVNVSERHIIVESKIINNDNIVQSKIIMIIIIIIIIS